MGAMDPADGGGSAGRIHQVGLGIDDDGAGVRTGHHVWERREMFPPGLALFAIRNLTTQRVVTCPGSAPTVPSPERIGGTLMRSDHAKESRQRPFVTTTDPQSLATDLLGPWCATGA
jgi:hypothetical protein